MRTPTFVQVAERKHLPCNNHPVLVDGVAWRLFRTRTSPPDGHGAQRSRHHYVPLSIPGIALNVRFRPFLHLRELLARLVSDRHAVGASFRKRGIEPIGLEIRDSSFNHPALRRLELVGETRITHQRRFIRMHRREGEEQRRNESGESDQKEVPNGWRHEIPI